MSHWESTGKSNEWYTPKYVFDAMDCKFDVDVAAAPPEVASYVPAKNFIREDQCGLKSEWSGFVWMNPPFGGRNGLMPWIEKFCGHWSGVALVPDRTSAYWYQLLSQHSDLILQVGRKIKFIDKNGDCGKSPSTGTTLFARGCDASCALMNARRNGLGLVLCKI